MIKNIIINILLLITSSMVLFTIFLNYSGKGDLISDDLYIFSLAALSFFNLIVLLIITPSISKKGNEQDKIVSYLSLDQYKLSVEILLGHMYAILKKYDDIKSADVYFTANKEVYTVNIEAVLGETTEINKLVESLKKDVNNLFEENYGYKDIVETKVTFKMSNDSEVVPSSIKKELGEFEKKMKKTKSEPKKGKKQKNDDYNKDREVNISDKEETKEVKDEEKTE